MIIAVGTLTNLRLIDFFLATHGDIISVYGYPNNWQPFMNSVYSFEILEMLKIMNSINPDSAFTQEKAAVHLLSFQVLHKSAFPFREAQRNL